MSSAPFKKIYVYTPAHCSCIGLHIKVFFVWSDSVLFRTEKNPKRIQANQLRESPKYIFRVFLCVPFWYDLWDFAKLCQRVFYFNLESESRLLQNKEGAGPAQ